MLKTNILNLMEAGEEATIELTAEKVKQPTSVIAPATPVIVSRTSAKAANVAQMFGVHAVQTQTKFTPNNKAADPKSVQNRCAQELNAFVDDGVWIPLNDDDGSFMNPLEWWKVNATTYPALACLALISCYSSDIGTIRMSIQQGW